MALEGEWQGREEGRGDSISGCGKRSMTPSYIWKPFQLILGLGLPMEVDVSMIIGYVMKFNYVLPYNASYLTDPYVRYDRSINRHVEPDGNDASPPNAKGIMFFALRVMWD